MPNKCCVFYCKSNYDNGPKKSVAYFPFGDEDRLKRWIRFVNRRDWKPTKNSVICLDHFDDKFIQVGEKTPFLLKHLKPVPTIHTDDKTPPSVLPTVSEMRKSPKKRSTDLPPRKLFNDKITTLGDLTDAHSPEGFTFNKLIDGVVYYRLLFKDGMPVIKESIFINLDLRVSLSYEGMKVPLPDSIRTAWGQKISKISLLAELVKHIEQRVKDLPPNEVIIEMRSISLIKPNGRPPYSNTTLRYALLIRYTSRQAYELLLEQFPLPSFPLIGKLQKGSLDALKVAKTLLQEEKISADCVILFDEMYLQKAVQYLAGKFEGVDENDEFFIVCFMVVSLLKSIPLIVKAVPETSINGKWLFKELLQVIENLTQVGFRVRATVCDNHSSNVAAYSELETQFGPGNGHYIELNGSKIYLFYDAVHLIKNLRNNLLSRKKFVFPSFEFDGFMDKIFVPDGYVDWGLIHKVYDCDQKLEAHLRKANELSYRALHPGNNKQNVPLALAIFHESTSAGIRTYFPEREDAAAFLNLINAWWLIANSKQPYHRNNHLGNAIVDGDNKIAFLYAFADWVDNWSMCPAFTLSKQTASALVRTLRCTAMLTQDLLSEGYTFVMTARYQTDPVERRIGRYRMMSGGRFLVGLTEVNNSEKILKICSLVKANVNFWNEDVYQSDEIEREQIAKVKEKAALMSTEIQECCLAKETRDVSVNVAGYISRKVLEKIDCHVCKSALLCKDENERKELDDEYVNLLSRGGLMIPGKALADFTSQTFAVLDLLQGELTKHDGLNVRKAAHIVLAEYIDYEIACVNHLTMVKKHAMNIIINVFFNNKQKRLMDKPRKDSIKVFKKRQRGENYSL